MEGLHTYCCISCKKEKGKYVQYGGKEKNLKKKGVKDDGYPIHPSLRCEYVVVVVLMMVMVETVTWQEY